MPATATVPIVTLEYEDLLAFDPAISLDTSPSRQRLVEQIGDAFGPDGLGIVAVRGVPDFAAKRRALLPLAAQLPHLSDLPVDAASLYSVGWSHGREEIQPGQPDVAKGSFYANPLTDDLAQSLRERDGTAAFDAEQARRHPEFYAPNVWPSGPLPQLQTAFCDLGRLLQTVGIAVARLCDAYCHARGVPTQFESLIRVSLNAKGRLLHYFAPSDSSSTSNENESDTSPWCAWHNDHVSNDTQMHTCTQTYQVGWRNHQTNTHVSHTTVPAKTRAL